jgi:hypothetical protein
MNRQEVLAVYRRGARARDREFIVMHVGSGAPVVAIDTGACTERLQAIRR